MRGWKGDGDAGGDVVTPASTDDETRLAGVEGARTAATASGVTGSAIAPGSLLGHTYRIEALLARGGMGEVYRARHAELNTEHAIKIILPELASDPRIVDLFRREAAILRNIRNEAVVGYDGVFRDENGRLYLVMEFVDGPSLSKVMKEGPLPVPVMRQLQARMMDGLAAAHDKGVIHRDLSPDNVILPAGDVAKAKIIDFGISKVTDPAATTILGDDFAGKYSFVSPEQLGMFGGQVDARADIYSLGLVLAAAAVGESLDMGTSPITVVEARRTVPDLRRVPAELRADLTAMLQPDPAERPQSLRELMRASSPNADAVETARVEGTARRSRPWIAVATGSLAALLLAAVGIAYWLRPVPDRLEDPAVLLPQVESALQ